MLASVVGSVVGSTVGASVQVLLENELSSIQDINNGYINLGLSYNDELAQLSRSLSMVQKHISDAETFQVRREAVKEWLKQLQDAAFDAEAVLDEVKYHILRCQVEDQNRDSYEVIERLSSATRDQFFKIKMSPKITDVINKLERINKDANNLGLPTAFALASQFNTVRFDTPSERETDSSSIEPDSVGRENDVSDIVEVLLTSPTEKKISVIPIVGMGGVGKTTLARKVFHDEKIEKHFEKRIWVCVSFEFDSLSLFKKILEELTGEEVRLTSKQVVIQKIKELLAGKRYLLVLDDIWNENNRRWGEFKNTLSSIVGLTSGNCIIVTTRKETVASQVGTLPIHQLRGLTDIHCWSIIREEAFPGKDVKDVPDEFESIGKDIAKKCGGLPLAAKVVGGLLHGKTEERWRSILENKLPDDNDINKILLLSYDNLPSLALKKCFAYCSVFPQDYSISKQELIEFWMAEGFLHDGKGDNMEFVGNEIFNHLLQCSLFQDAKTDFRGDIASCKMHDIVHDLACSVTKSMHQIRYLADTNESNAISQGQEKYLRTMFYDGKIANDMFSNFSRLHVLKIEGWEIRELPSEIEKLIHLRCLLLSSTKVECLPESIGKLYHLQTLSMRMDMEAKASLCGQ